MSTNTPVVKRNDYRPIRSLYLCDERCGTQVIDQLNRYAKLKGIPVRDAVKAIFREVLPTKIAEMGRRVKKK